MYWLIYRTIWPNRSTRRSAPLRYLHAIHDGTFFACPIISKTVEKKYDKVCEKFAFRRKMYQQKGWDDHRGARYQHRRCLFVCWKQLMCFYQASQHVSLFQHVQHANLNIRLNNRDALRTRSKRGINSTALVSIPTSNLGFCTPGQEESTHGGHVNIVRLSQSFLSCSVNNCTAEICGNLDW